MNKNELMKSTDIKICYNQGLKTAAEFYARTGYSGKMYNYYRGTIQAYGRVLGYGYEQVEKDIEDAITQYQPENVTV